MPMFARDAPTFTPEQAKAIAPTLAGTAMMGIPGAGPIASRAVNAGTGAVMGALSAEPGQRMKGARTGGLLGLVGGEVARAGTGLIGIMKRPGGILAMEGVDALRGKIAERSAALTAGYADEEARLNDLFKSRSGAVDEAAEAMKAGAESAAERATRLRQEGQGARVAQQVRGVTGVSEKMDESMALVERGKEEVRQLYYGEIERAHPTVSHAPLNTYLMSPELRSATRSIAPQVASGGQPTVAQLQEIRARFASGKFADRAIKNRLTQMMGEALGDDLATADAAYAGFSSWQRGAREGQKSLTWPASKVRERMKMLEGNPSHLTGFREGRVQDLVQKLQHKEDGAPILKALLDGGDEMDERLRTILPNDEAFNAIKVAIGEEKTALAEIMRQREITLNKLGNQRGQALADVEAGRQEALSVLGQRRDEGLGGLAVLSQRLTEAEAKRIATQESAVRLAQRIKQAAIGAALLGAGFRYGALRSGQQAVSP